MKKLIPLSLVIAFGNAAGSMIYDAFFKEERVFELQKYGFMFVFSFVMILVVLSLLSAAKDKQNSAG